ncbi:hypothetical protein [Nonomuraea jiangxiensis]|uniref:Uncharacterized protein n=1 Tax=Nonomuraea jiangxiensis TaxID=633440 RepID=A0A1G9NMM5_9ACTN|nr:hypothetical protein [Nonomuraea jiangxiensis]SDL87611.1 hypothetical protein SAMN05421869_13239 [Nonomuraea jiangxiensis]
MTEPDSPPEDDDRFHSIHVPEPNPDYPPLRWEPLRPHGDRARVRDYTCSCQPTYYELCQIGGEYFIRRTRIVDGETVVDETARGRRAQTMIVWANLLFAGHR